MLHPCIAMVNVVFLLFIWMAMTWKIPNLENLEFIHVHFKIFNYGLQEELMGAKCSNLIGINETKWTTFYFIRIDVLQNYLDQFLKCLADNFDNLKFQDGSKVGIDETKWTTIDR